MNVTIHPINVSVFRRPRGTVTGIEIGIETGRGTGTEIAIGERCRVDGMALRHRGSGTENVREMGPRGDYTRKIKTRRNHQSRSPPLSPGLSARCPSRQSLMVQCLGRTTCCRFLGTPSSQTSTGQGPPRPLPHDRLDHPPTTVHTKAPAGVGDDDVGRRTNLRFMDKVEQKYTKSSIYAYRFFGMYF